MYKYKQFGSVTVVMMSFFQNLMGNIVTLTKIYNNINTYVAANNPVGLWQEVGKLVKMMFVFDPMESHSLAGPDQNRHWQENKDGSDLFLGEQTGHSL